MRWHRAGKTKDPRETRKQVDIFFQFRDELPPISIQMGVGQGVNRFLTMSAKAQGKMDNKEINDYITERLRAGK